MHTRHGFTIRALLALLMLQLTGCAGLNNRTKLLDDTFTAYDSALRWQRYEVAMALHAEPGSVVLPNYIDAIRVTGIDAGPAQFGADGLHADRPVVIRYFHTDYQTERSERQVQQWHFDATQDQWRITSPLPSFPLQ